MDTPLLQAFFVVWRESVEALMVVGILHTWLRAVPRVGFYRNFLWGGVAMGCALAGILAVAVYGAAAMLSATASERLSLALTGAAAILIVHMVGWMHRKGPTLRRELEQNLADGIAHRNGWAIGSLAMIAVAREGSETVIFLFGIASTAQDRDFYAFMLSTLLGAAAAAATYAALLIASRRIPQRVFFTATAILLLLLGASLAMTAANGLAELDLLPPAWLDVLYLPAWDASAVLADDALGGLPFAVAGYRAQPSLLELGVFAAYWLVVLLLMRRRSTAQRAVSA